MIYRFFSFFLFFLMVGTTVFTQNLKEITTPEETREIPLNYKENYTSRAYDYSENISWFSRFNAWLLELISNFFAVGVDKAGDALYWLRLLFYLIVFVAAAYIIARLFLRKEGRWIFKKSPDEITPDIAIQEDIQSVNFKDLIAVAEGDNNYREATKYQYFNLLKNLDTAGFIGFDPQKTTYDYQLELEDTKFNKAFNKAAYYYTYIWYGEFDVDYNEYQTTSNIYTQILNTI